MNRNFVEEYRKIAEVTVKTIENLPVIIPEKGTIAGIEREYDAAESLMTAMDNLHYPMGTSYLTKGVKGVAVYAEEKAKTCSGDAHALYTGISAIYRAIAEYIGRYETAAAERETNATGTEKKRYSELKKTFSVLKNGAPETFAQAVQLLYLMWKLRGVDGKTSDLGRLDVSLRPFYERDLANRRITEETALALICELWQKLNRNCSGDSLVNVMVGGVLADGTDASSRLSVLLLRASYEVKETEPHINVRVHDGLRRDVLEAAYQLQRQGGGQATLYFDKTVIPELVSFGIPKEIANCYTNNGCTEIVIDGKSTIDFNHIDAVAAFELTLYNGKAPDKPYLEPIRYWNKDQDEAIYTPDVVEGFESGDAENWKTFDDCLQSFYAQYAYQVKVKADRLRSDAEMRKQCASSLLLNGTFDDVLESGKDIYCGGLPVNCNMMFSGSLPTVADCLMALKECVFEKKQYTISEIKHALSMNFEGHEVMRQRLLNAPKFGNDVDEVDLLSAELVSHFYDCLDRYRAETGFPIMPALLGWRFLEEAYGVGPTPDGRKYKDPIAEHYCATPGRAVNGPTALLNSVGKAALGHAVGVAVVHVSLPENLTGDRDADLALLERLGAIAEAKGLVMMNIAIYDVEKLKAAQKDPEHYGDVIVRVWGYSAKFVELCREMQDHVIRRTL